MTIKEIETLSGMSRANIRFYEAEGLLAPGRSANGYRDYSRGDLETLKRVKLLRSLRIPLEEIKALHNNTESLQAALDRHLDALDKERKQIDRSEEVCREMRLDGVYYQTLNAQKYLDALDRPAEEAALAADVVPEVRAPWRRFFARGLDLMLYTTVWNLFLVLVCRVNIGRNTTLAGLLGTVVGLVMMYLIEPLLLHWWGTTPGKWVMGLSVSDDEGRRLSCSAGRARTAGALWRGMGLAIPVYELVRLWKSYQACVQGEGLPWEDESQLILEAKRPWKGPVLACAAVIVSIGALAFSLVAEEAPRHRGGLTAAEFCGNYSRLADWNHVESDGVLGEDGKWQGAEPDPFTIYMSGWVAPPDFVFTQSDGVVTGVEFRFETRDPEIWPPSFQDQMVLSALAYAGVQDGFWGYLKSRDRLVETIQAHRYESFSFTVNGVTVTCRVDYSGYAGARDFLVPLAEEEPSYSFVFSMERAE